MNFAQQQRDPRRHLIGLTSVVLFHAILIYALVNGLGRKVVDVLKKPLDVSIIDEVKPPPPPPPPKIVQPPKVEPPPDFVPPPEVQVQQPAPEQVIVSKAPEPAPPVVAAPPAPPRVVNVGAVCPDHVAVLSRVQPPRQAQGQSGKLLVEFLVGPSGTISNVTVVRSTNPVFNSAVVAAVSQLHCAGQGQNVRVQVPFVFEADN